MRLEMRSMINHTPS